LLPGYTDARLGMVTDGLWPLREGEAVAEGAAKIVSQLDQRPLRPAQGMGEVSVEPVAVRRQRPGS
jgi:hypothetical protein